MSPSFVNLTAENFTIPASNGVVGELGVNDTFSINPSYTTVQNGGDRFPHRKVRNLRKEVRCSLRANAYYNRKHKLK